MRLTRQRLNRTLLRRQHLLERTSATPADLARHLIGLQGQEPLPPYLSLDARIAMFDPADVTRALEDRPHHTVTCGRSAASRFSPMPGT